MPQRALAPRPCALELTDPMGMQPAHEDAQRDHGDEQQRQADATGKRPYRAFALAFVGHHEEQGLAEVEEHNQQQNHQRVLIDGFHVTLPPDIDNPSIAVAVGRLA